MIVATLHVNGNEKANSLQEIHLQSPFNRGFRRYRIIIVNRNGNLAEYREDMGDAKKFKGVKQFNIPSIFEHTVDELLGYADTLRNETFIDVKDWLKLDKLELA